MSDVKLIGSEKLLKKLKKMKPQKNKSRLTAGFYKGSTYPDGTNVAFVAYVNNYGTEENGGFIPPRPFFSRTVKSRSKLWSRGYGARLKLNGYNVPEAMRRTGEEIRSDIKTAIKDWTQPPNAPSTIRQSGNPNKKPLKDTLHMRDSVGYSYDNEPPHFSKGGN